MFTQSTTHTDNSKVYVLILNYKKWEDVQECLQSLFRSHYQNFTAFVIDNASGNHSLEKLMQWKEQHPDMRRFSHTYLTSATLHSQIMPDALPPLVFVQNHLNNGFAAGNNLVLQYVRGEAGYVWLLNPDVVVEEDTLTALLQFAREHAPQSIIGTTMKFYEEPEKVHLYGGGKIHFNSATAGLVKKVSDIPRLDYISGGSLFCLAQHFTTLGLLPEEYFLYWEESDWCYQAKQKGFQMLVCTDAVCYDKIGATIGRGFLADFYYTRNGLLFVKKYKPGKIYWALSAVLLRLFKRIIMGKWKRAGGVYKGTISFLTRKNENK